MKLFAVFAIFVLAGCAQSGYKEFYRPNDLNANANLLFAENGEPPKLHSTSYDKFSEIQASLFVDGYDIIGTSSFNGALGREKDIRNQAKKVRATLVLMANKYTSTEILTHSQYVPTSSTTYHDGSLQGSNGGSAKYSGTSTTYGGSFVTSKSAHRRYDQVAVYYAKNTENRMSIGVFTRDLSDGERKINQRNTGMVVSSLAKNGSAFKANVLKGDLIFSVNDNKIINVKQGIPVLKDAISSGEVRLEILRRGVKKSS